MLTDLQIMRESQSELFMHGALVLMASFKAMVIGQTSQVPHF